MISCWRAPVLVCSALAVTRWATAVGADLAPGRPVDGPIPAAADQWIAPLPDDMDRALGKDWVEEWMDTWVVWPSEGDVKARGPLRDRRAEFPAEGPGSSKKELLESEKAEAAEQKEAAMTMIQSLNLDRGASARSDPSTDGDFELQA